VPRFLVLLALWALAACAKAPVRQPETIRHLTGGYIDEAGLFHVDKTPIVMVLPADTDIERARRKNKTFLLAQVGNGIMMLYWFESTTPDVDRIEHYMMDFGGTLDIDAQLEAAPMTKIIMRGATFARHKRWIEDDISIDMRVGCRSRLCLGAITYVGTERQNGAALDTALASLGFAE
jgi:hypothetical protein